MEWQPIETAQEFKTYLTQHVDDLYPVPAYRIGNDWLRETEGPEDYFYGAERHSKLYRCPTHYMPLPEPPQ